MNFYFAAIVRAKPLYQAADQVKYGYWQDNPARRGTNRAKEQTFLRTDVKIACLRGIERHHYHQHHHI